MKLQLQSEMKEKLMEVIIKDEIQYCFDRSYNSNDNDFENGRVASFIGAINSFNSMSLKDIKIHFGDQLNEIFKNWRTIPNPEYTLLHTYDCNFEVPSNWLYEQIKVNWNSISDFLDNYTWDDSDLLKAKAITENVIQNIENL